MAQIIQINQDNPYITYGDKALCMGYKEARQYDLNIPDYSSIKVGLFVSVVDPTTLKTKSDGAFTETITIASNTDRVYFGMKDTSEAFPGSGVNFVGLLPQANLGTGNYHSLTIQSGMYYGALYDDSSLDVVSTNGYTDVFAVYGNMSSTEISPYGLCSLNVLELKVLNSGQSTQQIEVYSNEWYRDNREWPSNNDTFTTNDLIADTGARTMLYRHTVDWNDGNNAISLPKSIFIYWPFTKTRLCIHGIYCEIE